MILTDILRDLQHGVPIQLSFQNENQAVIVHPNQSGKSEIVSINGETLEVLFSGQNVVKRLSMRFALQSKLLMTV